MEKLKVAVIGCGAVSRNHGKALLGNAHAELVAAVDLDFEKAEAFCTNYGGKPYVDYHEVLAMEDVDLVHVVTPHNTHPQIAIDALRAGKHVFCEKPLAIKPFDAERMVEESRKAGRRLAVCFQNRLNRASVMAKEIIDRKTYGEVVSAMVLVAWDRHGDYYAKSPWRGTYWGEGGGVIINQAIHTLDLLDYLCGPVVSLSAFDARLRDTADYEVDDSAMVLFRLKSGAQAIGFCSNCYAKSKIASLEIHLERATLSVSQSGLGIREEGGKEEFHPSQTLTGEKSEWGISHGALIDSFYRSILFGEDFVADGETGLAAVRIVNAIQHSKGKTIQVG